MRYASFRGLVVVAVALLGLSLPGAAQAQQLAIPEISAEKLDVYAAAYAEIGSVRDQYHAEFARTANKTSEIQAELRTKLKEEVAKIIADKGLTAEEYEKITWVVSVDPKQREALNQVLERQRAAAPR